MNLPAVGSVHTAQLERGLRSVRVLGFRRYQFDMRLPCDQKRMSAAFYYLARVHVLDEDVEQVIAVERLVAA